MTERGSHSTDIWVIVVTKDFSVTVEIGRVQKPDLFNIPATTQIFHYKLGELYSFHGKQAADDFVNSYPDNTRLMGKKPKHL